MAFIPVVKTTIEEEVLLKKYSFRLQTVLEMREKKLEDKRREMAKVIAQLNEQNQKLETLVNKRENTKSSLENIYEGRKELDILEITNYKDYLSKIITDGKTQEKVIENTKNMLKFKQLEVTNALKEVKIMEKLKETQQKNFYQHYEYVQAKEIDDIASTRYKRTMV